MKQKYRLATSWAGSLNSGTENTQKAKKCRRKQNSEFFSFQFEELNTEACFLLFVSLACACVCVYFFFALCTLATFPYPIQGGEWARFVDIYKRTRKVVIAITTTTNQIAKTNKQIDGRAANYFAHLKIWNSKWSM